MRYRLHRATGAERRPWFRRVLLFVCLCVLALTLTACGNLSGAYDDAVDTFAGGDYAEAAEAFDKLGDYEQAVTYAAYAHGLVFYEQGNYAAALPYFEQTQDFMYGRQRYAYCQASGLQDGGQFNEAATAFQNLGDFENSAVRALYCKARYAEETEDYSTALIAYPETGGYEDSENRQEDLQRQIYYHAVSLMEAGDCEQALKLFGLLGDYLHTREYIKTCTDESRDQLYTQAEDYEKQGELRKAYDLFNSLSGYRDAQSRADEIALKLGIDTDAQE